MSGTFPAREALRDAIARRAECADARAKAEHSLVQFEALVHDASARAMALEGKITALQAEQAKEWAVAGPAGLLALRPRAPGLRQLRDEQAEIADELLTALAARDVVAEGRDAAAGGEREAAEACAAARLRVEDETALGVVAEVAALEARAADLRRLLGSAATLRTISEPVMALGTFLHEPPVNVGVTWGNAATTARWADFRALLANDADAVLEP